MTDKDKAFEEELEELFIYNEVMKEEQYKPLTKEELKEIFEENFTV